jgi:hypothetical protein
MDADDLTVVGWYETAEKANWAAGVLVERGIGAMVEADPDATRFGVALLPADVDRGRQVLGLPEPQSGPVEDGDEDDLRGSARSMLVPVLVAAAVLVLVPLVAFLITFKLSGG